MNVDLMVLVEGGRGNGETSLCLWLFLKIAEKKEYTCMAEHGPLLCGPKCIIFTYIPWIIVLGYTLVEKIPVS